MSGFNRKEFFNSLKKKLLRKYRLVIMNDSTFEEKLSFKLTRMNVLLLISSSAFFLIIFTTVIIAFTPLREYIPGYSNIEDRTRLYNLSIKADSLERIVYGTSSYLDTLLLILTGTDDLAKINYREISRLTGDGAPSENDRSSIIAATTSIHESMFFYKPVDGVVVREFSPAMNHFGIDIVTPLESRVFAVRDGTVILANWNHEFGNMLLVQHSGNIISVYKHNSQLLMREGDKVKGGQVIALSGNSGEITTGPHLHFELWINGAAVNPAIFLKY